MNKVKQLYKAIQCYGIGPLLFRIRYALALKSGITKGRFPQYQRSQPPLLFWLKPGIGSSDQDYYNYRKSLKDVSFVFHTKDLRNLQLHEDQEAVRTADQILDGNLTWFSHSQIDVGSVPDWHRNPFTGQSSDPNKHWLDLNDFDAAQGDIKYVWEPSRFGWVYPLIRAFASTGDEKYAVHFWNWFENWLDNNPPNTGVNYKCGQECAIRCVAVCFAFYAFLNTEAATAKRVAKLVSMLALHADRIEKNINYARYQNNNHAVIEASGLFMIGLLFPEFKKASRWKRIGADVLEETVRKQIFDDGAYIQHSMNYHRLAMSAYLLALRLSELNTFSFSDFFKEKIYQSFEFLCQMQDSDSGRVPNYGANDGALLFSLDSCDYLDYRPVLGALYYQFNRTRLYPSGPWDRTVQWFFGSESLKTPTKSIAAVSRTFDTGGYYTIRQKSSWAMIRCHTYKTRPGHADMLHVDLWAKGKNILRDSGTYSYNCIQPWQNYFSSTLAHNCPVIDRVDQMSRGTRFMWFDWVKSKVICFAGKQDQLIQFYQGRHFGFARGGMDVIHQRSILATEKLGWLIVDDILGNGIHEIQLPWHLSRDSWQIQDNSVVLPGVAFIKICSDKGKPQYALEKGNENLPAGWQSLYYGTKEAATVFFTHVKDQLPIRIVTAIRLSSSYWTDYRFKDNTVSWFDDSGQTIANAVFRKPTQTERLILKDISIDDQPVELNFALKQ